MKLASPSHLRFYPFLLSLLIVASLPAKPETQSAWSRPVLPESTQVEMGGVWGAALARGEARIGQDPYSERYLLADLNFDMNRSFTNYSGDISGRYLELASRSSPPRQPPPVTLSEVMHKIPLLQKPDGHFGADIDWNAPIDFNLPFTQAKMMPTMWGNGRILLGLIAAYQRFHSPDMLEAARKLGDFYVNVAADRFCDPQRVAEYRKSPGYAGAYVTCVYQGVAGLVQLYRVTHDDKYLKVAERMADFHEEFDTLPVEHSHGSISVHEALLMLYEDTSDVKYLRRVVNRWDAEVSGGYVNPAGGVLEKLQVSFNRDEGCAESDWLRLNLLLWRDTGQTRYLDMAERLLWTEYLANQWADGGYGHRFITTDAQGAYGFGLRSEEALWCCNFHGPLGLLELKSYLAAGSPAGIYYNFPVDFTSPVTVGNQAWTVSSKSLPSTEGAPVRCEVALTGNAAAEAGVPLWVRVPGWADNVAITSNGQPVAAVLADGYLRTPPIAAGDKLEIVYHGQPRLETRLGARVPIPSKLPASLDQVVLRDGPEILLNTSSGEIQHITLGVRADGTLQLPPDVSEKLAPWVKVASAPDAPRAFVFNATLEPVN
jgi:DUF1680 family protein